MKIIDIYYKIICSIGCLILTIPLQYLFLEKANARPQPCDDIPVNEPTKLLCITPESSTLQASNMSGGLRELWCNDIRPPGKRQSSYDLSNYTYILALRGFTSFEEDISIVVSEFLDEDDPSIWIEKIWPGLFEGEKIHCQDINAGRTERLEQPLNLNPNSIYGIRVGKINASRGFRDDHIICVSLDDDILFQNTCPAHASF